MKATSRQNNLTKSRPVVFILAFFFNSMIYAQPVAEKTLEASPLQFIEAGYNYRSQSSWYPFEFVLNSNNIFISSFNLVKVLPPSSLNWILTSTRYNRSK